MPFKRGQSPKALSKKLNKILTTDLSQDLEAGLFGMYTVLSGTADYYVPVDTSNLVQSRQHRIERTARKGFSMVYGYYTNYAMALHSPKPGGKMDGWKPMDPYEREWRTSSARNFVGNGTGGWNPNARQGWMDIAWEESGGEAKNVFKRIISR